LIFKAETLKTFISFFLANLSISSSFISEAKFHFFP